MSRSGYSEECENVELWMNAVTRAIRGKRGQAFLRELADAMDAMPVKRLIAHDLIDGSGEVCAIGVVCKARQLDVSSVDVTSPHAIGNLVGIARSMAAEIEFQNDDDFAYYSSRETPEQRWKRMRKWVGDNLQTTS